VIRHGERRVLHACLMCGADDEELCMACGCCEDCCDCEEEEDGDGVSEEED
jgi:hypothetical protein